MPSNATGQSIRMNSSSRKTVQDFYEEYIQDYSDFDDRIEALEGIAKVSGNAKSVTAWSDNSSAKLTISTASKRFIIQIASNGAVTGSVENIS